MPLEPRRLQFALGHLPGHDDLEGPLAEGEFGQVVAGVAQIVGQQAVKLVALPVEFFLQGDHPAPDRFGLRAGLGQPLGGRRGRLHHRLGQQPRVLLAERVQLPSEGERLLDSGTGSVARPVPVYS